MDRPISTKSAQILFLVLGITFAEGGATRGASAGDSQRPALPASTTTIGPGLIVFNSNRSGNHEICVMNPDGSDVKTLTHDARYNSWWARVSPDRHHVLFYRNLKSKRQEDYSQTALWVMAADGSGVTELRPVGLDGWGSQGHAEWSPDGKQLVMFGGPHFHNPQIYITSNTGQDPRQITNRSGQTLTRVGHQTESRSCLSAALPPFASPATTKSTPSPPVGINRPFAERPTICGTTIPTSRRMGNMWLG